MPYDWRMSMVQKAADQSARRLTDLLTRPAGTGETKRDTGDTPSEAFAWSARRSGMPEIWEMGVVVLITQRSRVQIPPPLLVPQFRALSRQGEGLLRDRECDQRRGRYGMPRPVW